jgi:hypothetical protein
LIFQWYLCQIQVPSFGTGVTTLLKWFAHVACRPGPEKGSSAIDRPWIPVQEYFDTVAKKFQDGRWFAHKIEQ